ncbi:hypothetical protein BC829DRAFT_406478 [Chytridium lagenaria]|nr:hypothetical protein BC829DRAFT_406478 [Chytridium lagenaria]
MAQQFARTGISGSGGAYNFNANEFVPSAGANEFVPSYNQQQQYYQQPNYTKEELLEATSSSKAMVDTSKATKTTLSSTINSMEPIPRVQPGIQPELPPATRTGRGGAQYQAGYQQQGYQQQSQAYVAPKQQQGYTAPAQPSAHLKPPPTNPPNPSLLVEHLQIETPKEDAPVAAARQLPNPRRRQPAPKAVETPKEKKKPVEEQKPAEEFFPEEKGPRSTSTLCFIGHVDAGKSTMGGHLLVLTGMVDKRTLEKYEREAKEAGRESWYLSWALDLNARSEQRGFFESEKRRYTILDAPGHKNFVPSMMQGAAQADFGVLVISARKGGQTREHAMLAKTVGVKRLIIVINKMDDPTVNWDQARYDDKWGTPRMVSAKYRRHACSGFTGANLKDRLAKGVCSFYDGPSLIELLDNLALDRKSDGPLICLFPTSSRTWERLLLGKIESGRVRKGQQLLIMPNKKVAEVMAIFLEDEEKQVANSGENIRLRLKNVEEEDVLPGFVVCTPKRPVHAVTAFEARLAIVEYKSIICAGYTAVCHAHTNTDEVTLAALLHKIDKKTGKRTKNPPQFVRQGESCIVRIECASPVCLEKFDEYPQLGRFTLRDEGKTVAIGRVTKLIFEESQA